MGIETTQCVSLWMNYNYEESFGCSVCGLWIGLKAASGTTYYPIPTPPQVLEAAAKIISQRRAQAAALHLGACTHDSHYEEIDGKLHRCSCWKRARLAMQAAGQPLTLPEVRHEDI